MRKVIPLTLQKSTGGTHVYGNEDQGFKGIYLPKLLFPAPSAPPREITLTLDIPENGVKVEPVSDDQL